MINRPRLAERPKIDQNRQKYSQIKSYFESSIGSQKRSGSQSKLTAEKDNKK